MFSWFYFLNMEFSSTVDKNLNNIIQGYVSGPCKAIPLKSDGYLTWLYSAVPFKRCQILTYLSVAANQHGLVPSGKKPLPKPMVTQTQNFVAIWRH